MTTKTIYVADDGSRWDNETDARRRDNLFRDIEAIMAGLKPKPGECAFTNGYLGYIQHDPDAVESVRKQLFEYCDRNGHLDHWTAMRKTKIRPLWHIGPDWFCRIIDDDGPIYEAWSRLNCFDFTTSREYGQPYLARHQDECPNKEEYKPEAPRRSPTDPRSAGSPGMFHVE